MHQIFVLCMDYERTHSPVISDDVGKITGKTGQL